MTYLCYEYSIRNTSLETITEEKDLGFEIDRDLNIHMHVSKGVNKASIMLGLVRATFKSINATTLARLLSTMVRPHLVPT